MKDSQSLNPLLAFESRAALALGDRAAANALADELVEAWRSIGIRQPDECTNAPWVFRDLARADELREALERETGTFPWHEAARRVISDDLAGAADVYAEIGSVPDEAYTRLRAAEELVRAGDRAEADRQLRLALPVFAELGAAAWTAEAEKLLARQPEPQRRKLVTVLPRACQSGMPPSRSGRASIPCAARTLAATPARAPLSQTVTTVLPFESSSA